jgi:hypothetical protein
MSATETEKESAASRELGRQRLLGSTQADRGERRAREQRAVGEELGFRAENEERGKFLFLFPFQIFQSILK